MLEDPTQLVGANLQYSGTECVRPCSFPKFQFLQLSPHMTASDRQVGKGSCESSEVGCWLRGVIGERKGEGVEVMGKVIVLNLLY